MAHIVTGVPTNAAVIVYAQGRFRQWKGGAPAGSLRILATESAYPIRIAVRSGDAPGGVSDSGKAAKVAMGTVGGAQGGRFTIQSGPSIDFYIQTPDEHVAPGAPRFLHTRRPRSIVNVQASNDPPAPEFDIYQRVVCLGRTNPDGTLTGCGNLAKTGGQKCEDCEPLDNLCTAPTIMPSGERRECTAPRIGRFDVCYQHAVERRLISEVVPLTATLPPPTNVVEVVSAKPKRPRGRPRKNAQPAE